MFNSIIMKSKFLLHYKNFLKYSGWFVVILAIFLFGVSIGSGYKGAGAMPINQNQNQTEKASLMVDYGNGKVETYNDIVVKSGETVFDVLKKATENRKVDLKYKDYGGDLGIFVESIGGIGKDPFGKKWWQYWVNNKYSQVGASTYKVVSGDIIEFKFTEGQK